MITLQTDNGFVTLDAIQLGGTSYELRAGPHGPEHVYITRYRDANGVLWEHEEAGSYGWGYGPKGVQR